MSDAPDRIWATGIGDLMGRESGTFVEVGERWPEAPNPDAREYVRADAAAARIAELEAQLAAAYARLEMDHEFHLRGDEMVRVEINPKDCIADGIACRDATIELLQEQLAAAYARGMEDAAKIAEARAALAVNRPLSAANAILQAMPDAIRAAKGGA